MVGTETGDILIENWRGGFRHSAGQLGSHYLKTLREQSRFLGWRTGQPVRVLVPPKDLGGEGAWVDVGPGAILLSALSEMVPAAGSSGLALARVRLDGADSVMFARVDIAGAARSLHAGDRLTARFAPIDAQGRREFWFEPLPGAQ